MILLQRLFHGTEDETILLLYLIVLWWLPNQNWKPRFLSEPSRTETEVFLEPSEDGFALRRLYLYSVKLHEQTDGQTYKYARQKRPPRSPLSRRVDVAATCGQCQEKQTDEWESNLVHFSLFRLKMWHLVAKMLTNFLKNLRDQTSCIYWLIPDFIPPLNLCEASLFVPPIGWIPLTDTMDKETNEWTNEWRDASLRPSVS